MAAIPSILELMHIFSNEEAAIKYLLEQRVLYLKTICECGGKAIRHGKQYRCTKKTCRRAIFVFKDSFFANGRLKINESMLIGYLWLCNSTHTSIRTMTGHSSNTITDYLRHFRQLAASSLDEEDDLVGGQGIIVEVDESKFGKRKYHRGHRVEGAWVIGGVERTEKRKFFAQVVEKRDAATIISVLSRHIKPGSIVHTDCWRAYSGIDAELGITHDTVNHSLEFVNKENNVHTNTIEGSWRWLKASVSLRGRVGQYLPDQLLEQIWRRKHEKNIWNSFISALRDTLYE
jgi:transposase-like protein